MSAVRFLLMGVWQRQCDQGFSNLKVIFSLGTGEAAEGNGAGG
jgi:hypothetical protein